MALVVLVLTFMISFSLKQKKASGDDDEYCFMLHNLCIILHHVLAQFVLCVRGKGGKVESKLDFLPSRHFFTNRFTSPSSQTTLGGLLNILWLSQITS